MNATMRAIKDYYVASTAIVTGNVVLSPGVNLWFNTIVRGDIATITFEPRVNIQDGCILLPTGPGWGADLNEDVLREHPWEPAAQRVGY